MSQRDRRDFERHWRDHNIPEISLCKYAGAHEFLAPVFQKLRAGGEDWRILDVGCGDGVHGVALEEGGGERRFGYWGIDFSVRAIRIAKQRLGARGRFNFLAGDALALPFPPKSFDAVFSYGVLAYTGAAETALAEMARVCKPGGLIGIWMFPQKLGLGGKLFSLARFLCRMVGARLARWLIHLIVLFSPLLPLNSGVNLKNSSWRQCAEVLEVSLLPQTLDMFTLDEVLDWFRQLELSIQVADEAKPVLVWAIR